MGQNIGTCVTALISSVGANKNARRAAMVHLYFNIIGVTLFLAVFYGANLLLDCAFVMRQSLPGGIAVVHSIFNLTATAVLLPFAKGWKSWPSSPFRTMPKKRALLCWMSAC